VVERLSRKRGRERDGSYSR